jgi:hypothetical protein
VDVRHADEYNITRAAGQVASGFSAFFGIHP